MDHRNAVVTGASSGIGAATVRRLRTAGYGVVAAARRRDRLDELAAETGCTPMVCDVTSDESVAALAAAVPSCAALVNNAGMAVGMDSIATGRVDDWQAMFDVNVLGVLRMTRALLPRLVESGDGIVVNVGSIAGHIVYEGGGGYTAAKHGLTALTGTLRLELCGQPVRVTEIAPGMVRTAEFSLKRLGNDPARADQVYEGVAEPLTAEDIADCIEWVVTRPSHMDIDLLVVKPRAQAAAHKVHREPS